MEEIISRKIPMIPPWLESNVSVCPTKANEDTCDAMTVEATKDPIRKTLVGLVAMAYKYMNTL